MKGLVPIACILVLAGCTHDFAQYEPVDGAVVGDGGADASKDGASCTPAQGCLDSAGSCGGQCKNQRDTCVNGCGNNNGCKQGCFGTEKTCRGTCASTCLTCATNAGCAAQAACNTAAGVN